MKILLPIIVILLALGAGVFWFQTQSATNPTHHTDHADHAADVYYCPMHPQIQSDRPGDCPICYMKLVKREDGASSKKASGKESKKKASNDHATVELDEHQRQMVGIRTTAVEKKALVKTIRAYGYVAHDLELYDAQLEYINAWRAYYTFEVRRPVKDEFRADWREYYKKEPSQNRWKSIDKVEAQQRFIKAEYELRHLGMNDAQMKELRTIKYGQPWVQPELLFFDEGQPVWIYAQIFESDLGFVDVGQKALITIPAYGETVEGIVRTVAPVIDPMTRTARVRIELPSYKGGLSVNMSVDVAMPVELNESVLVPREAVMDAGSYKIVFVEVSEGVYEPRRIETGFEGNGMLAVKSGLKAGERIVIDGNFLLDSESRLRSTLQDASDPVEADSHAGH